MIFFIIRIMIMEDSGGGGGGEFTVLRFLYVKKEIMFLP